MRAIETSLLISEDRILSLQLPREILPGNHQIFVIIDEQPQQSNGTIAKQSFKNFGWQIDSPTQGLSKKTEIHAAVLTYARQNAGTEMDIDYQLEEAGIECLNNLDEEEKTK
ncbi:hypothetical protein PN36_29710 [Candidatus Thiomargarita nelsonii]|uniref:Uncharacterized protein n=1 Tax=Candidatus Thiomargarita nelsonii TaxID=1003181 RepID=A0A0A6PLL2_9GAMM|nr:hypothetical protein PN36_29710 [Candidatus Thiomargarita nelsonii]